MIRSYFFRFLFFLVSVSVFLSPSTVLALPESAESNNSVSEQNVLQKENNLEEVNDDTEKSSESVSAPLQQTTEPSLVPDKTPEGNSVELLQPAEPQPAAEKISSGITSFFKIPSLEILPDTAGTMKLTDVMQKLSEFTPWKPSIKVQSEVSWFLFYESPENLALTRLYLDLGSQIPKNTEVWTSTNGKAWQKEDKDLFGLYTIKGDLSSFFVLIRIDGFPGPWFKPVLSSESSSFAVSTLFFRFAADIALGIFVFLSILLFIASGKKQFICITLLAAAALLQSFFAFPSSGSLTKSGLLLSIFSACIASLMYPHLGRIFLNTQKKYPFLDYYLLVCTLVGIILSALPYFKSYAEYSSYLIFWPLIAIPCLPPAFFFMLFGEKKTFFFFLSTLSLALSSSLVFYFLLKGEPLSNSYEILRSGLVLGILFVMIDMSSIKETVKEVSENLPEKIITATLSPIAVSLSESEDNISSEVLFDKFRVKTRIRANSFMDELVQNACNLNLSIPANVSLETKKEILHYADNMVFASRQLVNTLMDLHELEDVEEDNTDTRFELRRLISDSLAEVFADADKKGLGVSWFISPSLYRFYSGDIKKILSLLSLLLADSIKASKEGTISLRITPEENNTESGRIRFAITDNGTAFYPLERNTLLIQRALEMSGSSSGDFSLHCSSEGSTLSFVVQYVPIEDEDQPPIDDHTILPPSDKTQDEAEKILTPPESILIKKQDNKEKETDSSEETPAIPTEKTQKLPSDILGKKEKKAVEKCVVINSEEKDDSGQQYEELVLDVHEQENMSDDTELSFNQHIPPKIALVPKSNKRLDPNTPLTELLKEDIKTNQNAFHPEDRIFMQTGDSAEEGIPQIKPFANKRVEKTVVLSEEQILDEHSEIFSLDVAQIIPPDKKKENTVKKGGN